MGKGIGSIHTCYEAGMLTRNAFRLGSWLTCRFATLKLTPQTNFAFENSLIILKGEGAGLGYKHSTDKYFIF